MFSLPHLFAGVVRFCAKGMGAQGLRVCKCAKCACAYNTPQAEHTAPCGRGASSTAPWLRVAAGPTRTLTCTTTACRATQSCASRRDSWQPEEPAVELSCAEAGRAPSMISANSRAGRIHCVDSNRWLAQLCPPLPLQACRGPPWPGGMARPALLAAMAFDASGIQGPDAEH